ncbi:unnamed protein product [Blepharisma stoltei]|uniref:non-specific serine/threonine protein kinase n=1 Tax=Blepharisma stoltei TaxID=1481888 RepID=A0AAU9J3C1_9CILI|nr:unnamed protein product [Blepharisma stoltei]
MNNNLRELDSYYGDFTKTLYVSKTRVNVFKVEFTQWKEGCPYPKSAIMKEFLIYKPKYEEEAKYLHEVGNYHKNIVNIYHYMNQGGKFLIFMEICSSGSVGDLIKQRRRNQEYWPETQLLEHFVILTEVMSALHSKGIVHRDIKPDNIFVGNNEYLKVGDFGAAKYIKYETVPNTVVGTQCYMSPFLRNQHNEKIIRSVDIIPQKEEVWSLGKSFYEMATLNLYEIFSENQTATMEKVQRELKNIGYSDSLIGIITKMLVYDLNARPSMIEIYQELKNLEVNLDPNSLSSEFTILHSSERSQSSNSSKESGISMTNSLENNHARNCEICKYKDEDFLIHACGWKIDNLYFLGWIKTLIVMGFRFSDINCQVCSKNFSKEVFFCETLRPLVLPEDFFN